MARPCSSCTSARAARPSARRRAELVVDDERAHAQSLDASLDHSRSVAAGCSSLRQRVPQEERARAARRTRRTTSRTAPRSSPAAYSWLSARSTSRRKSSSPRASASASGSCVNMRSRITTFCASSGRALAARRARRRDRRRTTSTSPVDAAAAAPLRSPARGTICAFDLQGLGALVRATSRRSCRPRPRSSSSRAPSRPASRARRACVGRRLRRARRAAPRARRRARPRGRRPRRSESRTTTCSPSAERLAHRRAQQVDLALAATAVSRSSASTGTHSTVRPRQRELAS